MMVTDGERRANNRLSSLMTRRLTESLVSNGSSDGMDTILPGDFTGCFENHVVFIISRANRRKVVCRGSSFENHVAKDLPSLVE